jgi:hypothetical protein
MLIEIARGGQEVEHTIEKTEGCGLNGSWHYMNKFSFVTGVLKYLNCATFLKHLLVCLCHGFALYSSDKTATYT